VIAQLFDAAYYKDGIFRQFYIYFCDNEDAKKFSILYNRESRLLNMFNKLKDESIGANKDEAC
jgi:hypothetical protein